jgi:hypothetical protein
MTYEDNMGFWDTFSYLLKALDQLSSFLDECLPWLASFPDWPTCTPSSVVFGQFAVQQFNQSSIFKIPLLKPIIVVNGWVA